MEDYLNLGPASLMVIARLNQTLATVPLYTVKYKQEIELFKQEMELFPFPVQVYASLREIARVCASLRESVRVYASLREFTRVCASLCESACVKVE